MLFKTLTVFVLALTLSDGLPLEGALKPRAIAPRAKSYSIVNVDGGSSTPPPPKATTTTVVEKETKTKVKTETLKVTDTPPTVTDTVTTAVTPTPAPGPTSKCSTDDEQSAPSPSGKPVETPAPSVVTIIITETTGPTEFYDNGMWHTNYPVKTFESVVAASADAAALDRAPTPLPTLEPSPMASYNQTQPERRWAPAL
ncbi:hypothetical protein BS50DRAFT_573580 [Corynespora cassiicola Philippines]|uniref:Uncharacterized protein n=1 Tax=Corynespora cassiicola Philippines TaxID=1448308 RepID=A0A2T2NMY1_CORCC|nr:hypothetical protein BS50DRAFT_573580 [Corynespora cassiicola Philippines]